MSPARLAGAAQSSGAAQSAPPAVPRRRSRVPRHPRKRHADGFLQRWLILEPIRTNGQLTDTAVQAAVKAQSVPTEPSKVPRHGDKVTVGDAQLAWHAVDTIPYNVNLYHFATR